jgi:hypothetical protein
MSREARIGFALLGVAVALGVLGDAFFHRRPLGLNVLLFVVCFIGALAVVLHAGRAPLHQGRRWMCLPLLGFAAAFVWHDSPLLTVANLAALAGAVSLGALRRTQTSPARAGVGEYGAALAAAGAGTFAGAIHLLHREVAWDDAGARLRGPRAAAIARGAAIGLPLVLLFGGLFMAADTVFKSLASSALPNVGNIWTHLVVAAAFAWAAAGLLRDLVAPREQERVLPVDVLTSRRLSLGATEIAVALGAVNIVFAAFVAVQARYLFGGRSLVEARAHLTYAHYARHGFFELVAVSVLLLPVLLGANALVRGRVRIVCALSFTLVLLELAVAASALQRLRLYTQEYGLTELRIYTTGVVVWLVCVFAWLCVTTLRGKGRFAVGMLVLGFAATAALNVLNPDALIARTNLTRPQVDVAYLDGLSDDAIPTLLERLSSLRPDLRSGLAQSLLVRRTRESGLLSWNASRARSTSLLASHEAELAQLARSAG